MKNIKIKKIDSLSVFKTSVSIGSITGFIIGVIFGSTSIPIKTTISLNGEIVHKEILTKFWNPFLRVVFSTTFYFVVMAVVITLISVAFNIITKTTVGMTVEIEKE